MTDEVPTLDSIFSQLEQLVNTAGLPQRYDISSRLQQLSRSIATSRQIIQHYGYIWTEQVVAKIAIDLDLFTILVESKSPLETTDIANKCGGEFLLVDRILRYLASTNAITEVGESQFVANNVTPVLASGAGKANIMFGFNLLNKAGYALPEILKEPRLQNSNGSLETAFQRAFQTKMQFFEFVQQDAEMIRYFHESLVPLGSPVSWCTVYPLAEKLREADKKAPLFVDVGGGHGWQCVDFRKVTAEHFHGRVILQDLPETIAEAPDYDNIELMAQNFYEENQVQGARIYYLRRILHDLTDENVKRVLRHIKTAMSPQSILLIDDMVLPERGASLWATQLDVTMLTMFNSLERTAKQWNHLLGEVGLKIFHTYSYDPELEGTIIEAILA